MQIDKDLNSEYAELFLDVRAFLAQEIEKYSSLVREKYSQNITTIYSKEFCSAFCYIRVKENYVHIGWFNGSKIADEFALLFGNGKQIRGHKVYELNEKSKKSISYYVQQSYFSLVEKDAIKKMRHK
jgi:hypothetical protein